MRSIGARITLLMTALAVFGGLSYSQEKVVSAAAGDKYVISAKAGGINLIEGMANVVRKEGRSGVLVKGDDLAIGDRVSTGADGKVEILLNPGSYLRLGGNTEFEFKSTDLEKLQLQVDAGSAILEVFADNDFRVKVSTPKTSFYLVRTGVYRIDVAKDGSGSIEVWKGRAMIGDSEKIVKAGYEAEASGNTIETAKFDRDEKDSLEAWSKARSKELSKMIASLDRRDVRTSLVRSFLGNGWNMYDSFGLWVYSPFSGAYCFLPFGYGWYSPYGYGYSRWIDWYRLPPVVYYPPANVPTGGSPTTPNGDTVRTKPRMVRQPTTAETRSDGPVRTIPVFTKIQNSDSGGVTRGGGFDRGGFDRGGRGYEPPSSSGGSAPTYVPPPTPTRSGTRSPDKKP